MFTCRNDRDMLLDKQFRLPQKERLSIISFQNEKIYAKRFEIFSSFSAEIWLLILLFWLAFFTIDLFHQQDLQINCLKNMKTKHWMHSLFVVFALIIGQGLYPVFACFV